jgi:hypothetical protein
MNRCLGGISSRILIYIYKGKENTTVSAVEFWNGRLRSSGSDFYKLLGFLSKPVNLLFEPIDVASQLV